MMIHHRNLKIVFGNKACRFVKLEMIESDLKLLKLFKKKIQQDPKTSKQDFSFYSAVFVFTQALRHYEMLLDAVEHLEKIKGFKFAWQIDLVLHLELNEPKKIGFIKGFTEGRVHAQRIVKVTLGNNQNEGPSNALKGMTF